MMDLESIIRNQVDSDRRKQFEKSNQLSLGELILKCENLHLQDSQNSERLVHYDSRFGEFYPTHLMSWRGIYAELAIGYQENKREHPPTLNELIFALKAAIGKTYEGYKGGDYTMSRATPIWISNYGESRHDFIIDVTRIDNRIILITREGEP